MQVELPPCPGVVRDPREPVTGGVASLQGGAQQGSLLGRRQQPDGGDELHGSGTILGLDVTPDYALGGGPGGAGVVAAAPQGRQARSERAKLLARHAARPSLETIDDLGDGK